jgi:Tol biopolymer transport system component
MRLWCLAVLLAGSSVHAAGQIHITAAHTVPLPEGQFWMAPGWAPDGRAIFVTSEHYRGLWRYDLETGTLVQITDDAGAGFGWSVAANGSSIAYRRTIEHQNAVIREQEIVQVNLATGTSTTLTRAASVDLPVYSGNALLLNDARQGMLSLSNDGSASGGAAVLGIENTKIALMRDGAKKLLDPFGDGSYIWPSLSPAKDRLVAYDMARGAFVCTMQGTILARLGRIDAPSWTRSGRWIVSMHEQNDGHIITGSDLYATSADGRTTTQLTSTPVAELAPCCSPVENRIVCATTDGTVVILTYEEANQ